LFIIPNLPQPPQHIGRDLASASSALGSCEQAGFHSGTHLFADEFLGKDEFVGEVDNGEL
jgi:hypothetical protein